MLTVDELNERTRGTFAELLGVRIVVSEARKVVAELDTRPAVMASNGFLDGGTVVGLADTVCGYGCAGNLPEGANGYATIELKTNFIGTAREGTVSAEARMVHAGRTTQVWDAEVRTAEGRTIALFRCTQAVLYPRPNA